MPNNTKPNKNSVKLPFFSLENKMRFFYQVTTDHINSLIFKLTSYLKIKKVPAKNTKNCSTRSLLSVCESMRTLLFVTYSIDIVIFDIVLLTSM